MYTLQQVLYYYSQAHFNYPVRTFTLCMQLPCARMHTTELSIWSRPYNYV